MKKTYLLKVLPIILALGFIIIFIGNNISAAQNDMDLHIIAQNIEKQHGKIIEWSLYAREFVYLPSEEARLDKTLWLEKQFPHMEWSMSTENGTNITVGKKDYSFFSETIKLISTDKNRQASSYIMYEMKGTSWNQHVEESIQKQSSSTMKLLFDKKPVIFSCIKGEFNENFHEFTHQSLKGLLQSFQAEEINSLKERDFYSISAKSSLFAQTLSFTSDEMNMQIGLRKNESGPRTTFVIGTPILTIEY